MYHFAIVGSGVSGGRVAYELTRGGAKCVLLEAGREFDRHSFPPDEMGYSTQMFWSGGMEVSRDGRLGFLRGKCLGGTSVVNQADLDRFDDVAWDRWRQYSGIDDFNRSAMDPLYEYLEGHVAMGEIPREHYNRNAELFIDAFQRKGYAWSPIVRSQTDCALEHGSDCIVCLGGCPRDAKQSALITTIRAAREQGLTVETEFEVGRIVDRRDHLVLQGRQRDSDREVTAAHVVLAGGVLGNCALLFRSPELAGTLPALGRSFCCHPQYMTYGVFDDPVDAHKGALQSVQGHDERLRMAGVKLENVFAGPIATGMLMPGFGSAHQRRMKQFRHLATIEVAVMDDPAGTISRNRSGRLVLDKPLTTDDRGKIRHGLELVRELLYAAGARQVIMCHQGFGLHLMGGCPIGTDPARSVVNPEFRLHTHPRVFVADSSVFPASPGINPSYTIMALSYKASQAMLAH